MPRKKVPRSAIDIWRPVSYCFIDDPESSNFPLPTFIFVYSEYAAVDAIFRCLVGKDDDAGIARKFILKEELNLPMCRNCAAFLIEVQLVDAHRDFMSLEEVCALMERLMTRYGRASTITRRPLEDILNM